MVCPWKTILVTSAHFEIRCTITTEMRKYGVSFMLKELGITKELDDSIIGVFTSLVCSKLGITDGLITDGLRVPGLLSGAEIFLAAIFFLALDFLFVFVFS